MRYGEVPPTDSIELLKRSAEYERERAEEAWQAAIDYGDKAAEQRKRYDQHIANAQNMEESVRLLEEAAARETLGKADDRGI